MRPFFLIIALFSLAISQDSLKRWSILPAAASSPETGVQAGVLAVHYLPKDSLDATRTIGLATIVSVKKQVRMVLFPNIYWGQNQHHFEGALDYRYWPANYYGIGSETNDSASAYTTQYIKLSSNYSRALSQNFWIGATHQFHYNELDWKDSLPHRFNDELGFNGNRLSGLGLILSFEQRDNRNDPTLGYYLNQRLIQFAQVTGSDFTYTELEWDARAYQTFADYTLALGGQLKSQHGNVPLLHLSSQDGTKRFRGIEKGRYRDKNLLSLQSEIRTPLYFWNIGFAAFTDFSQVAQTLSHIDGKGWIASFGGGIRYAMNPKEKFNVRVDVGFVDGTPGLVIDVKEAF